LKGVEVQARRDIDRYRSDAEFANRLKDENERMRLEIQRMYDEMRRINPQATQMYGEYTNNVARQQPSHPHAPNGVAAGMPGVLPPPGQHQHWAAPPPPQQSNAMQGVEYNHAQPYDHR